MDIIKFKIITESNCLIGSQTIPFSTGGIDQSTLVDEKGYPMISGSSFKGTLRNIYRENNSEFSNTKKYVDEIFNEVLSKYNSLILELEEDGDNKERIENLKNIAKKISAQQSKAVAEYIFGIEGLNNTPKLYFSDIKIKNRIGDKESYFIIDMKNTIEEKNNQLESKPRTYKCVKAGVEFEGSIRFGENGFTSKNLTELKNNILQDVKKSFSFFNDGFYGIGNSKSRGYGNIKVEVLE